MSNSDSRFMRDEELRILLNKWNAPEAPGSLDQRITASYRQSMSALDDRLSSLDPQRDSEVVKMKFCNTCQEQFADRFSFCPVDGTPLTVAAAPTIAPTTSARVDVESSYPMAEAASEASPRVTAPVETAPATTPIVSATAASTNAAHTMIGEYHLTILEDKGLLPRLASEIGEVAHN